jgi:hypothetical protein
VASGRSVRGGYALRRRALVAGVDYVHLLVAATASRSTAATSRGPSGSGSPRYARLVCVPAAARMTLVRFLWSRS